MLLSQTGDMTLQCLVIGYRLPHDAPCDGRVIGQTQRLQPGWERAEGSKTFHLAVVYRVFLRLQLGEISISFHPLANHSYVLSVVAQFRQVMNDS